MSRNATMPGTKKAARSKKKVEIVEPSPSIHEEESDREQESDVEIKVDGEPEKDATEEELERLVFGDSAGFREGLRDVSSDEAEDVEEEEQEGVTGLEGLDDAQVGQTALYAAGISCF